MLDGTVPTTKLLLDSTVPSTKFWLDSTVPAKNFDLKIKGKVLTKKLIFRCPKTIEFKSDNHIAKPMNTKKHLVDASKCL